MTGDEQGRDPVEDFFARERADVPSLAADEVRWERILARSRWSGPRRWIGYAAAAAAACLVVGALGWGLLGRGPSTVPAAGATTVTVTPTPVPPGAGTVTVTPTPVPPGARTVTVTPGPARSAGTPPATGTTGPAPTAPAPAPSPPAPAGGAGVAVPASFLVRSVSNSDGRNLFALGTSDCGGGRQCPALATSPDDGATWRLVRTFPGAGVLGADKVGGRGGSGVLSQVRFANASVGWVFGGGIQQTTDGGATWHDYPHQGGDVIALETDGKDVVLTTADRCVDGGCQGTIRVLRAPVTATAATDVAGRIDRGSAMVDAAISWHQGHAYISPVATPSGGSGPAGPMVLMPDGLHPAGPAGCGLGQALVRLVAPAVGSTLFAVCPSGAAAGHTVHAVAASADAGKTWRTVSTQALVLVNAGTASFAATDAGHLLAVSGGSSDLDGSMAISPDGGLTWRAPKSPPPLTDRGWAWVGSPGGATYYAVPSDPLGGYWKSTNRGETWAQVTVAAG
jgi:hypothetical protein